MAINTKKVEGRRAVRYNSLDELLADARRLSESGQVRTLGNWSEGQIYKHLAGGLDSSIDGAGFSLPAPVRWVMSMVMKRKFLHQAIPAGFQAPGQFQPEDTTSVTDGLACLEKAIERQKQESTRAMHPAFGNISREEWNDFNLRHAELHMSFLVNGQQAAG